MSDLVNHHLPAMNVKLVSISRPVVEGLDSPEDLMVYCARVSNPSNQLNTATGAKLLAYCIEHGHWSVFETASMTVEITTSRAIAAQILRHRSFSFQEFSQRYSEVQDFEPFELRHQADKNRQSSSELFKNEDLEYSIRRFIGGAEALYRQLLDAGVARECARMILPLCTQTTLYMTGSVRSWIHYLKVRCDEHTQKEHYLVAQAIERIFCVQFPVVSKALSLHGPR
jgi:thymidylate synthase (FAD)